MLRNSVPIPGPADLPADNAPQVIATDEDRRSRIPLTDSLATFLADNAQQAAMIEGQRRGAILVFMRENKLKGEWNVIGHELVRAGPTE